MEFKIVDRKNIPTRNADATTSDGFKTLLKIARLNLDCVEIEENEPKAKSVVDHLNYVNKTYFNNMFIVMKRGKKIYVARRDKNEL